MTKIWGVRVGLIGDLIMALPVLTYLKKKHPNSYITWVIHKNCSQCASLFLNHPLIDRIKITDEWCGLGNTDHKIIKTCDIVFDISPPVRDPNWRNEIGCIEETARMAHIDDLTAVLSKEELKPKLYKWFPSPKSLLNPINDGYSQIENILKNQKPTIAIWPFANYMKKPNRSPTKEWWCVFIELCKNNNITVEHYGYFNEPLLGAENDGFYTNFTSLPFDQQIKLSLDCDVAIGTDSGSMWVLGAYSMPAIHLMTYHEYGHNTNPLALEPSNDKGFTFFNPKNINLIRQLDVLQKVKEIIYNENTISR